jgi:D-sedoheptulose 7-phosphate isomerase
MFEGDRDGQDGRAAVRGGVPGRKRMRSDRVVTPWGEGPPPGPAEPSGFRPKAIAAGYVAALEVLLDRVDLDAVERVVERLRRVRDSGGTVFIAGNGGSAATASHWANDLGKATKRSGRIPMRVMCLSDNVSWLTALANDEGYERAYAGQLENFAGPDDVLIVISASGNSANLVAAVEVARECSCTTVGFVGFDGGVLKDMADEHVWISSPPGAYELVEDGHSVLCHILTTCLMQDRASVAEIH